jgi:tetratricopeptide (TPR) repeat protein
MAIRNPRWVIQTVLACSLLLPVTAWSSSACAQAAAGPAPTPAPAPGDEEKARAHFRLGRAHYDNGDFAQAAVEFEEAYRISQRAALLYNIYLAYRDANDTRHAATALRNYLTLEKEVENRGQLESRLAALERSLADGTASQPAAQPQPAAQLQPAPTQQPAAPATPAQPAETQAAPAQATAATPAESKHSNVLPLVLIGTGGAMVLGSAALYVVASGKQSDLNKLCPNKTCAADQAKQGTDLKNSGQSLALVGDILMFGGLAVAGTGLVMMVMSMGKGSESSSAPPATTASLVCVPGLCGGALRTTF